MITAKRAIDAFWAACVEDGGMDSNELKAAMAEYLGIELDKPQGEPDSDFIKLPVEYQYAYPDGSWRCSNGREINGSRPSHSRALYARKDSK